MIKEDLAQSVFGYFNGAEPCHPDTELYLVVTSMERILNSYFAPGWRIDEVEFISMDTLSVVVNKEPTRGNH